MTTRKYVQLQANKQNSMLLLSMLKFIVKCAFAISSVAVVIVFSNRNNSNSTDTTRLFG